MNQQLGEEALLGDSNNSFDSLTVVRGNDHGENT